MKKLLLSATLSILLLNSANAQTPTKDNLTKLYIATFNRAPDKIGLDYWLVKSQLDLEGVATSFFEQQETQDLYPKNYDTANFVNTVYQNLFNRTADDGGMDYWSGELNSGHISRSLFILAVTNGATGNDNTILQNKATVGAEFISSNLNDVSMAKQALIGVDATAQSVSTAIDTITKMEKDSEVNAVFKDPVTGLMWQDNTDAKTIRRTLSKASEYCKDLILGGYEDWGLPSLTQLSDIYNSYASTSVPVKFENVANGSYWTSSTRWTGSYYYITFSTSNTRSNYTEHNNMLYFRCVRED